MAINTFAANQQADRLRSYETQLTQAKNSLRAYQYSLTANWAGEEASHINRAIEQVLSQITAAQNQLAPLAQDIKNTAEQIRREEEAAAALAQKQAQIRQVSADLEAAQKSAEELKKKLDTLIRNTGNQPRRWVGAAANQALINSTLTAYNEAAQKAEELQDLLSQLSR